MVYLKMFESWCDSKEKRGKDDNSEKSLFENFEVGVSTLTRNSRNKINSELGVLYKNGKIDEIKEYIKNVIDSRQVKGDKKRDLESIRIFLREHRLDMKFKELYNEIEDNLYSDNSRMRKTDGKWRYIHDSDHDLKRRRRIFE